MRPHATRLVLVAFLGLGLTSGADDPKPKETDKPLPPIPKAELPESPFDRPPDLPPPPGQNADQLKGVYAPVPDAAIESNSSRLKPVDGPPASIDFAKSLNLNPIPPAAIPDDPPPHEGAIFSYPMTIEPPDYLLVEVLEGLAGRPITGERVVRPDGTVTLGFYGEVHVAGLTLTQAKAKITLHLRKYITDETLGIGQFEEEDGTRLIVGPEDTDKVFVDLSRYSSKNYFVEGDVAKPGRLPRTGNETVLDALSYAGGPTETHDPKNIRLVRPARGSKPAKVYPIDLDAILNRGDRTANLQIFPGDRLIIGRDPTVTATIRMNRQAAPFNTAMNSILTQTFTARSMLSVNDHVSKSSTFNLTIPLGGRTLTLKLDGAEAAKDKANLPIDPSRRDAMMREMFDTWFRTTRPDARGIEDEKIREEFLRRLLPPQPEK